jgi:hypothetical protein
VNEDDNHSQIEIIQKGQELVFSILNPSLIIKKIEIYNLQGKVVASYNIISSNMIAVPINLPSGIYIAKVETNNNSISKKIQIVR